MLTGLARLNHKQSVASGRAAIHTARGIWPYEYLLIARMPSQ